MKIKLKPYSFLVILTFVFLTSLTCYADETCPHNKDILEYDSKIEALNKNLNMANLDFLPPETVSSSDIEEALSGKSRNTPERKDAFSDRDDLHAHMGLVFEKLMFNCAEKLVGQGVDNYLFMAGFPDLLTSITPDRVIASLEDVFLYGDHRYFVKNNERIVDFLHREGIKGGLFQDSWHKVYDFALAAKFSLEEDSSLAEMKAQAERANNPLDFALYLPVWQGAERREQFTQLCLELGCNLGKLQECSPDKTEDLWTVKATYIASAGDIVKVGEYCTVSANNNGKFQELLPIPDDDPLNYAFNFRKIGVLNSNCHISIHRYYLEKYDFANADSCGDMTANSSQ